MPRPIAPRLGPAFDEYEYTLAEDQHEYNALTVCPVIYKTKPEDPDEEGQTAIVQRWTLSHEEREAILLGEDIYLQILTFGEPVQPLIVTIGKPEWAK